jgi:hypothetical protein
LPVIGAVVELRGATLQRVTRSDELGAFHLRGVPSGRYSLSVRQIGYEASTLEIAVTDRDTTVVVGLTPIPQVLSAVRVRGRATGIYGVVGTSAGLEPIAGASIRVMGAGRPVATDSAGRYFVSITKPGLYVVRISHRGYADQVFSIDVPADRPVEGSRLLYPGTGPSVGLNSLWNELDQRLQWRGMNSALVPGSQLRRYGGSLTDALQGSPAAVTAGVRVSPGTCVFVNGVPRPGWPLDAFSVDDVEVVELYGRDETDILRKRWPAGAECGDGRSRPASGEARFAVVWLKR